MTGRTRLARTLGVAALAAGLVGGLASPPATAHVPDSATTGQKVVTRSPANPRSW